MRRRSKRFLTAPNTSGSSNFIESNLFCNSRIKSDNPAQGQQPIRATKKSVTDSDTKMLVLKMPHSYLSHSLD